MAVTNIAHLMEISLSVMDGFSRVEPKPWNRKAVLLELLGELGSLAHCVQQREGFKQGTPSPVKLNDECSDVLFMVFRLAQEDGIELSHEIKLNRREDETVANLMVDICVCLARLVSPLSSYEAAEALHRILRNLAAVADSLGVNLEQAHEREMRIAQQFFEASGNRLPRPQLIRRPLATIRLWRMLWEKRNQRTF